MFAKSSLPAVTLATTLFITGCGQKSEEVVKEKASPQRSLPTNALSTAAVQQTNAPVQSSQQIIDAARAPVMPSPDLGEHTEVYSTYNAAKLPKIPARFAGNVPPSSTHYVNGFKDLQAAPGFSFKPLEITPLQIQPIQIGTTFPSTPSVDLRGLQNPRPGLAPVAVDNFGNFRYGDGVTMGGNGTIVTPYGTITRSININGGVQNNGGTISIGTVRY